VQQLRVQLCNCHLATDSTCAFKAQVESGHLYGACVVQQLRVQLCNCHLATDSTCASSLDTCMVHVL
jgi:hypothetical protein